MDNKENENLSGKLGSPYGITPILNRSNKRRRKEFIAYVEIDGKTVLASQPKKAKRK